MMTDKDVMHYYNERTLDKHQVNFMESAAEGAQRRQCQDRGCHEEASR